MESKTEGLSCWIVFLISGLAPPAHPHPPGVLQAISFRRTAYSEHQAKQWLASYRLHPIHPGPAHTNLWLHYCIQPARRFKNLEPILVERGLIRLVCGEKRR
jgi:hypothetical protein